MARKEVKMFMFKIDWSILGNRSIWDGEVVEKVQEGLLETDF